MPSKQQVIDARRGRVTRPDYRGTAIYMQWKKNYPKTKQVREEIMQAGLNAGPGTNAFDLTMSLAQFEADNNINEDELQDTDALNGALPYPREIAQQQDIVAGYLDATFIDAEKIPPDVFHRLRRHTVNGRASIFSVPVDQLKQALTQELFKYPEGSSAYKELWADINAVSAAPTRSAAPIALHNEPEPRLEYQHVDPVNYEADPTGYAQWRAANVTGEIKQNDPLAELRIDPINKAAWQRDSNMIGIDQRTGEYNHAAAEMYTGDLKDARPGEF